MVDSQGNATVLSIVCASGAHLRLIACNRPPQLEPCCCAPVATSQFVACRMPAVRSLDVT